MANALLSMAMIVIQSPMTNGLDARALSKPFVHWDGRRTSRHVRKAQNESSQVEIGMR